MSSFSARPHNRKRIAALALALLVLPVFAWAHAHPAERHPQAGATLDQAPKEVRIRFTEELEPAFSYIHVSDRGDDPVTAGSAAVEQKDAHVIAVPLKALKPGEYTVSWKAVARDGHTTHGTYTFRVK